MNLKSLSKNGSLVLALLVVCGVALPAYADSLNLVVNGSFEDYVVSADSQCGPFANCVGFYNGSAGYDNIAGWQLIGKSGIYGDGNPIPGAPPTIMLLGYNYHEPVGETDGTLHFHPQHGLQSVDLTGEGNQGIGNGIKQSVATVPGKDYTLTFWLGHQFGFAPGYTEGPGALEFYIDGQLMDSIANSENAFQDVAWTRYSHTFTANESETVIAFLNDTPVGNNYSGLDNVSLSAVPEPSSLVLLCAGIASLAAFARKRD